MNEDKPVNDSKAGNEEIVRSSSKSNLTIALEDIYLNNNNQNLNIQDSSTIIYENDHLAKSSIFCYVCYDNVSLNSYDITQLTCGHQYCRTCFSDYVRCKVVNGQVDIKCFHPVSDPILSNDSTTLDIEKHSCDVSINQEEIIVSLNHDQETLKKYHRFASLKRNSNMRECCFCSHIQLGNPKSPSITCDKCSRQYCYFHANAHPPEETCEQYESKIKNDIEASIEVLNKISKRCPKCGMAIAKSDGCNHMKCTVCSQAFCWICGKAIDDAVLPAHFQWWNPTGCANMQMNEATEPSRWTRISARILTWIELLLVGPLTLVTTVSSFILCSCCLPHFLNQDDSTDPFWIKLQRLASNCMSGWGIFWIGIVFFLPAAFILLGFAIGFGGAAFVMIYPVYATYRICTRRYPWPDSLTRCCGTCCQRISDRYRGTNQSSHQITTNQYVTTAQPCAIPEMNQSRPIPIHRLTQLTSEPNENALSIDV